MEYKNESKTIIGALSAVGLIGGGLTSIIATVVYAGTLDTSSFDVGALSSAAAWQSVGNGAVAVGLLSLIGYLIAHSFAYDLKFRFREDREARTTEPSAGIE